ncbi:FtsX-like permease family protein [Clostridium oryzae]|uniref:ABC transporter permease YtrF n=1 Tax=Clostridium oryzae TaxID=1450648 RepID=A0A1V4IWJ8_9CLOT|nr:FtsX-like permease family protein [Clostridium oryzae]OPJ64165.1 ABC transporter permease YtrF precursor [Clostridium oryzae]
MKFTDIVKRYISFDKKNSLIIVISIIICTALFLCMNIINSDAKKILVKQAKDSIGGEHAIYYNPTNAEVERIKNNSNIKQLGKQMVLGSSQVNETERLLILNEDKNMRELEHNIKIKKGSLPIHKNEIAISDRYFKLRHIENPIGKNIELSYVKENSNGEVIYKGKKSFKVMGVLYDNALLKRQALSWAYIAENAAKKYIPMKNKYDGIVLKFEHENNINRQISNLVKQEHLNKKNISPNKAIIGALDDESNMRIPYITVNIVVALATALLIYNIFNMLVLDRTKDLGVMRALGFTPFDVGKIVLIETGIYSIISILIGLIAGTVLAHFIKNYVIAAIYSINDINNIAGGNHVNLYIKAALLSGVTILISILGPMINACTVEPIVDLRNNKEKINIKSKTIVSDLLKWLFNDTGNIASKNLQRNKQRTFLMMASVILIAFLCIVGYTKATSNYSNDNGTRILIPGDYLISSTSIRNLNSIKSGYDKDVLDKIKKIVGITKVNAYRNKDIYVEINENKINKKNSWYKKNKRIINQSAFVKLKNKSKIHMINFNGIGVENPSIIKNLITDGNKNPDLLMAKAYVYLQESAQNRFNIKIGDKIKVNNPSIENQRQVTVAGFIKDLPMASQQVDSDMTIIMSVNLMNKIMGNSGYERFDIWSSMYSNKSVIASDLEEIAKEEGDGKFVNYKNESEEYTKENNQKSIIIGLVVGIIAILSLFNYCNSIFTSINNRSREFALFRGIGITKREIFRIITLEINVCVLISYILSLIPALIIRRMIISDVYMARLFDVGFAIILAIILLSLVLISYITSAISFKRILKDDFIDKIKTL